MMLMEWVLAIGIAGLTWAVLRGGWRQKLASLHLRPKGNAIFLAIAALATAMWYFDPVAGLALTLVVVVHEFGHVAAYRVAGHPDARFRLIPMVGGVAISKRRPENDLHDVYITVMGPGISLALMVFSFLLRDGPFGANPLVALFLTELALFTAAINFLNLLPIYPLDGGRIAWTLLGRYAPGLTRLFLTLISLAICAFAVWNLSIVLFIFALFTLQALSDMAKVARPREVMGTREVALAIAAWLMMIGTFWLGMWMVAEEPFHRPQAITDFLARD